MSRAAASVRRAELSPCSSCGRETKTSTDGHCVECWAAKTADALDLRPSSRTEQLFDIQWDDSATIATILGAAAAAVGALVYGLTQWI